jgi:hypothetical protein
MLLNGIAQLPNDNNILTSLSIERGLFHEIGLAKTAQTDYIN